MGKLLSKRLERIFSNLFLGKTTASIHLPLKDYLPGDLESGLNVEFEWLPDLSFFQEIATKISIKQGLFHFF